MRIEIKKISIMSLLFSALPVAVFSIMLIGSFLDMFAPTGDSFVNALVSSLFRAIVNTLIVLVCTLIGAFVYNLLCAIGLKGIKLDLEDK
ncbi:hypothetical protein Emin_1201 [Elusimicrobium minutum Pei191]|uniref:DUF3566 domain-containing protein n=1 Tax=Elusimicrobium minutum (strain Pei191) TaxID=445932 RepID=B2KE05_ELUMP|nr:hypothetical protein [Elusimicrobium minutum]ACC98751.1 hypothetical protein Emin_1201 [Elusimicrobium minutum Pei191]